MEEDTLQDKNLEWGLMETRYAYSNILNFAIY